MRRRIYFATAVTGPPPPNYDADAAAFIAATGIAGSTPQQALHDLVTNLKTGGVWAQLHAIYPMVGGTSLAHSRNLKNPADSDAAFRLTFVGSPIHSANGVAWDGMSQYADTHYVPSAHLSAATGASISYYAASNTAQGDVYEMGAYLNAANALFLCTRNGSFSPPRPFVAAYVTQEGDENTDARGDYLLSRPAGSPVGAKLYLNGANQNPTGMVATDSSVPPPCAVTLGVLNVNGFLYGYSNRACRFASLGAALSEAQISAYHAAVHTFQTALGRAL